MSASPRSSPRSRPTVSRWTPSVSVDAATLVYARAKGWAFVIPPGVWPAGLAAALLIGALAGLLPAIGAARLSPSGALEHLTVSLMMGRLHCASRRYCASRRHRASRRLNRTDQRGRGPDRR